MAFSALPRAERVAADWFASRISTNNSSSLCLHGHVHWAHHTHSQASRQTDRPTDRHFKATTATCLLAICSLCFICKCNLWPGCIPALLRCAH